MNKYFLMVITDNLTDEKTKKITDAIFELIDDIKIKYSYFGDTLFFSFNSEIDRLEIHDYLDAVLDLEIKGFVITEINNTSIKFPEDMINHLFGKSDDDDEYGDEIEWFDEEHVDENIVSRILNNLKKITTKPSLDSILDKIKETGINSLTEHEKDTLNEYSKF